VTNKIGSGRIDNQPVQVGSDRSVKRAKDSAGAPAATVASKSNASTADGVSITDSARQLAALEQAIKNVPDVNEAKVAKTRAAIADGTYQVAPSRIADKLLNMEKEFQ